MIRGKIEDLKMISKAAFKKGLVGLTVLLSTGLVVYAVNDTMGWQEAQKNQPPDNPAAVVQQPDLLKEGTEAPDFTLKTLEGKAHSLKEYWGKKKVLIEFFSSRCPHCQHSVPYLNFVEENYGDDVVLLSINAGDDPKNPSTTNVFKTTFNADYTILELAANKDLPKAYHLRGFPTSYLIDADGKILWAHEGAYNSVSMIGLEKALFPNEAPKAAFGDQHP